MRSDSLLAQLLRIAGRLIPRKDDWNRWFYIKRVALLMTYNVFFDMFES